MNSKTLGPCCSQVTRNGDTYDAVDLVKWRSSHLPRPQLSDDETERWLRAVDSVFGCNELAMPEAASVLSDFIRKHGDTGRWTLCQLVCTTGFDIGVVVRRRPK